MRSVNKVTLIGHLTRDPEVRMTSTGSKVATFSLATNRVWKDPNGSRQEATDYVDCVAWAGLANVLESHVSVGQAVYVEGSLRTRSWEAQDGSKRHKTEVVVRELNILTWREGDKAHIADDKLNEISAQDEAGADNFNIEDIPF